MKTRICICPFAQFGNPGTMAGAELLGDALHEMLDDSREEDRRHRSSAFSSDVEIEEIEFKTTEDYADWQAHARDVIERSHDRGEFMIWIGGNHLSVRPLYEAFAEHDASMVVQLDAHLDLYHLQDCVPELSHGNFLRQLDPLPRIVNVGHRDLFLLPEEVAKYYGQSISATDFIQNESHALDLVASASATVESVLLDIDVDVLDPAYFPAVVDALPFGLTPQQLLRVAQSIEASKLSAIAISEFEPGRDVGDRSLSLLVWLVEWSLLRKHEKT